MSNLNLKTQSFKILFAVSLLAGSVAVQAQTNIAPVAMVTNGIDRVVIGGEMITLSGTGTDEDGTIADYLWQRDSGTDELESLLGFQLTALGYAESGFQTTDAVVTAPTVTAAASQIFAFRVRDDDAENSPLALVTVRVFPVGTDLSAVNRPPIADIAGDTSVMSGETFTLDGGGSSDSNDAALTYAWSIDNADAFTGTTALTLSTLVRTANEVTSATQQSIRLIVNDGTFDSAPANIVVTILPPPPPVVTPVPNTAPTANAGVDQTVETDGTADVVVTLTGVGDDPDGDNADLTYLWTGMNGDDAVSVETAEVEVTISGDTTANTALVLTFAVADADFTVTDSVTIRVNPNAPPTGVTAVASPSEITQADDADGEVVAVTLTLTGTANDDDALMYMWTVSQGGAAAVSVGDGITETVTLTDRLPADTNLVFVFTATDTASQSASVTLTVTVNQTTAGDTALQVVLPEVMRAFAGASVAAISGRVAAVTSGRQAVISQSQLVLPLNATAENGLANTAFWANADYRDLSGESGATDWNGGLSGLHLGVDTRVRSDLLVGVGVSWLDSEVEYNGESEGDLEINMTSVTPYLGWNSGELAGWAMLGYGEGEVKSSPDDGDETTHDLTQTTIAVGGSGLIWQQNAKELRLKGEVFHSESEVDEDGEMVLSEDSFTANRLRFAGEFSESRRLANGGLFTPSVEFGARYDGGDGETGGAAEVGGALSYHNPRTRLTAEVNARALLGHSADTQEWGLSANLRAEAGADGQGFSFALTPGYGDADSGKVWKGLTATDADTEYHARLNARIGYGIASQKGVVTPFGAMTAGESERYRMGVDWQPNATFGLNLLGERKADEGRVVLEGEVRF